MIYKKFILTFYLLTFCLVSTAQKIDTTRYQSYTHYDYLRTYAFSFKTKWLKKGYQSYKLNEKTLLNLELNEASQQFKSLLSRFKYWHVCLSLNPEHNLDFNDLEDIINNQLQNKNFPNTNDDLKTTISKYNKAISSFKHIVKKYEPIINSFYELHKERLEQYGPYAFLPEILAELENTKRKYHLKDFIHFLDAEFKPFAMNGVYLDDSTRYHIARQAVIKGIVFMINAGNSGNYRAYNYAQKHADAINEALKQKNIWFLGITKNDLPAYLMMRDLFDNMFTKANGVHKTEEECQLFYESYSSLFKRNENRYIEVLIAHELSDKERPHEVIRRFRQSGINALLPNYQTNTKLPFMAFTLGNDPYPLNTTINDVAFLLKEKKKWSTAFGEKYDKTERYYLRVDEVFPQIDKDFDSAKAEIKKYLHFLDKQYAFMSQLGIKIHF